jgi:hypothetical protein
MAVTVIAIAMARATTTGIANVVTIAEAVTIERGTLMAVTVAIGVNGEALLPAGDTRLIIDVAGATPGVLALGLAPRPIMNQVAAPAWHRTALQTRPDGEMDA